MDRFVIYSLVISFMSIQQMRLLLKVGADGAACSVVGSAQREVVPDRGS